MDTNRIKRFATEARNILKAGIAAKILSLGFDQKGNVPEENMPQLMQGGSVWNGQLQTEGFYRQWMALYNRIQQIGIKDVYEEAAYTWFNRLCAIRILQKNNLCSPVLAYADAARTPIIVDEARQGRVPQMKEEMRQRLAELLDDDTKVTEQFAILITAWCHDNPIIQQCFGGIADYTELLLPNNILAEGGFVDLLNHTEFITDDDFHSPELIGWLYQFYISERKDEVFAKKGKFEADEIPAATQIFTPNWIVKYMVQNTVGRIYLDNNPYETQLQKKWQYLVEPTEKPSEDAVLKYDELTDLKVADLACGSGHILNECFDLLYDLYIAEGYSRTEAVENIFANNLTGIDLDTRAKQLATFALLLKACQKDSSFADAHVLPNVLDMAGVVPQLDDEVLSRACLEFIGGYETVASEMLKQDFELLRDADNLGSIMQFNDDKDYLNMLRHCYEEWTEGGTVDCPDHIKQLLPGVGVILALTDKYHALVMNPPYMGSGKMNAVLSKYVKDNYDEAKADLFSVFMQMGMARLAFGGKMAQINMQSWMFLSSFERLRDIFLHQYIIDSMLHLGPRTFDELSGEVVQNTAFVLTKPCLSEYGMMTIEELAEKTEEERKAIVNKLMEETESDDFQKEIREAKGTYYRLVDGKNCADKEQLFLSHIHGNEDGNRIYYPNVEQKNFEKIPGSPIGYWASDNEIHSFESPDCMQTVSPARIGMMTTDNNRFVRKWQEISINKIGFNFTDRKDASISTYKWFPYNKGGGNRRWYGLNELVVNWQFGGREIIENGMTSFRGKDFYFKEGITWSFVSSMNFAVRYKPTGFIFDIGGSSSFPMRKDLFFITGFLNSIVAYDFLSILNPTLNFQGGNINSLPLILKNNSEIEKCVKQSIQISKADWDSHETSWDFQRNPLIEQQLDIILAEMQEHGTMPEDATVDDIGQFHLPDLMQPLEVLVENYKAEWEDHFMQLHQNEEELNRQFISIYGLEDELTPDVPLNEITILQQGEINVAEDGITWNNDVIAKQLISYAVGCMLGRYRLDKPGLHIAHPNPTDEETAPYLYNGEKWEIDDDGIMPLMANDCGFSDNASVRFSDFLRVALGNEKHVANLNYVEKCLGKTIEQYFVKDFWKDHNKMYQKRPIYWLFSSKKGAFQVIAYMHRMNAYTAERVRAKYLLPYIEHLEAEIAKLDARRAELTTKESKQQQQLQKQLDECREYHERLQVVAEQAISFDLDDGVVVNYAKFGDVLQKIK